VLKHELSYLPIVDLVAIHYKKYLNFKWWVLNISWVYYSMDWVFIIHDIQNSELVRDPIDLLD